MPQALTSLESPPEAQVVASATKGTTADLQESMDTDFSDASSDHEDDDTLNQHCPSSSSPPDTESIGEQLVRVRQQKEHICLLALHPDNTETQLRVQAFVASTQARNINPPDLIKAWQHAEQDSLLLKELLIL